MPETSPEIKEIFDLMLQIPPDLTQIRKCLEAHHLSPADVNRLALCYVEECWEEGITCEDGQTAYDYHWEEACLKPDMHSTYLYEIIKLFLDFGLDPNAMVDGYSILNELPNVVNEYVGADTLALLFEHGADPNLKYCDGENLFSELDFAVIFDAIEQYDRRRYDALVHSWFVFLGYGAVPDNGTSSVDLFNVIDTGKAFDLGELRNHRNYTFGLSHVKNRGENWSLHIFDKWTMWEVARL